MKHRNLHEKQGRAIWARFSTYVKKTITFWGAVGCAGICLAGTGANREARVDAEGVLRWVDDGGEVALLGVNYYTPFTIDYSEIKRLGFDHRQAILDDVAHFRRLGLGCVRVHCFDREFSDAEGNLIDNHHMEMLDFLIATCASNGIYSVMTPIAWWGGAYAPGNLRGFSDIYPMHRMTADRTTWPAQARFLKQFAEHVNRFTGRRYADDPAVLAFESINEPLYPKDMPDSLLTEYINTLTDALRASGTVKPIYYSSWMGRTAAAGASRVDGVTCSYYPTGLVNGRELEGPQLRLVRASSLRPDEHIARKSRMVYEFDAADMCGSYMYPALAKLFRFEGNQVASQFQYDPMALADANRNWQTHHLNLVYTPNQALSLAIAAEVFAYVPRAAPFEPAEEEMRFPPFRVSTTENLSEMVSDSRYLHSNTTRTPPPNPAALERVWGCGSSPVVTYNGTGAYFFDRVSEGVWRLQLYPDVFTVADPFTGSKETKIVALPTRRAMTVRLPDLNAGFHIWTFDGAKPSARAQAENDTFTAECGDYLLMRSATQPSADTLRRAAAVAPRFTAPTLSQNTTPMIRAKATAHWQWRAGSPLDVTVDAVNADTLTARFVSADGKTIEVPLKTTTPRDRVSSRFEGTLERGLTPGTWGMTFHAAGAGGTTNHPSAGGAGMSWQRTPAPAVSLLRIPETPPTPIRRNVGSAETSLVADGKHPAIRLTATGVGNDSSVTGYTLPIAAAAKDLGSVKNDNGWGLRIVTHGASENVPTARAEIGLRLKSGKGLGFNMTVGAGWSETVVPAAELLHLWGLPSRDAFRWEDVTEVSVLTGSWMYRGKQPEGNMTFDIAALEWVKLAPSLLLDVVAADGRWSLFDRREWLRVPIWGSPLQRWGLSGDDGKQAIHLGMERFEGEFESMSLRARCDGKTFARLWQTDGADAVLSVRVRAARPKTTSFELVFIERDGVSWGTNVPLTPEWQTVRIPVSKLKLFTHWDKEMAAKAGSHLRVSRLEAINVCFGKWLFPQAASEPHAFEISEIGIERGN